MVARGGLIGGLACGKIRGMIRGALHGLAHDPARLLQTAHHMLTGCPDRVLQAHRLRNRRGAVHHAAHRLARKPGGSRGGRH